MTEVRKVLITPEEFIASTQALGRILNGCTDEERDKITNLAKKLASSLNESKEQPKVKNLAVYELFAFLLSHVMEERDERILKKHLGEQNGA